MKAISILINNLGINRKKADISFKPSSSILFVCRMNLCRSPFAEFVLKKRLRDWGLNSGFDISSAGTMVTPSGSVPDTVLRIAADLGVDLSKHRPRQITSKIIDSSNVIITADKKVIREINSITGTTLKKTVLLSSFCPGSEKFFDILDPFNIGCDGIRTSLLLVEYCIEGIVDKIIADTTEYRRNAVLPR